MLYPATYLILATLALILTLFWLGWYWARTHGQFDDVEERTIADARPILGADAAAVVKPRRRVLDERTVVDAESPAGEAAPLQRFDGATDERTIADADPILPD